MLITNHTRKTITVADVDLPVGKPVDMDEAVFLNAVKESDSIRQLVLTRKISAVKNSSPKKGKLKA